MRLRIVVTIAMGLSAGTVHCNSEKSSLNEQSSHTLTTSSSAIMLTTKSSVGSSNISASAASSTTSHASSAHSSKTISCGMDDDHPCPMQAWMRTVIGPASMTDDRAKLAQAFEYVASKPPPGMEQWVAIAKDGAAKARKGEFSDARRTCKKCHELYKDQYVKTMRERPF